MHRTSVLMVLLFAGILPVSDAAAFKHEKTITGNISSKSVVHSGAGLFFAQNMMYRHTITVYNRQFELVKTISDRVNLAEFGVEGYSGTHQGAPVEAAFSHDGRYAWVSNYNMTGKGFGNPGHDSCSPKQKKDHSFLYRVDTETLEIDRVIAVGAVPKFIAVTPDNRFVLVTNWCSWDLMVVDIQQEKVVRSVYLGRYPRGIAVTADSATAYVAVMGTRKVAAVTLADGSVAWLEDVGRSPRHLNIDPNGRFLYATLNGEGKVAKIDLQTRQVLTKIKTGRSPRSMVLSDDGTYLYVVNYNADSVSKVRTEDMKVLSTLPTGHHPIGITFDADTGRIWVACYSGTIMVFDDSEAQAKVEPQPAAAPAAQPASSGEGAAAP